MLLAPGMTVVDHQLHQKSGAQCNSNVNWAFTAQGKCFWGSISVRPSPFCNHFAFVFCPSCPEDKNAYMGPWLPPFLGSEGEIDGFELPPRRVHVVLVGQARRPGPHPRTRTPLGPKVGAGSVVRIVGGHGAEALQGTDHLLKDWLLNFTAIQIILGSRMVYPYISLQWPCQLTG